VTTTLPSFTGREPCRIGNPERFFPTDARQAEAAKRECAGCPLVADCLDYALHHAVEGVWGGTTRRQRDRLRRQAGIVAEPVLPPAADAVHRIDHDQVRRMVQRGTPVEAVAELTNTTVEMVRRIVRRTPVAV
jgi:WhiB family redox-sensing transcriptional regulator